MNRALDACVPRRMLLLAAGDAVAITAALALALAKLTGAGLLSLRGGLRLALVSGALLLCLHYYDLYESRVTADMREVSLRLAQALGTVSVALALTYYLDPALQPHYEALAAAAVLVGLIVVTNRRLFWACNRWSLLAERTVLLGQGRLAVALASELRSRPETGLRLVATIAAPDANQDLMEVVRRAGGERVLVSLEDRHATLPLETLVELRSRGVRVSDGAEVFESATAKVALEGLDLQWLLTLDLAESRAWRVYNRAVSQLVAGVALLMLAPLLALVALAVHLESPGPVIFRQQRIGRGGRTFRLFKFRSMWHLADRGGAAVPVQPGDARLTQVGKFIRRCRIDELPQLFNILRGDLGFVGPRPFVPEQEQALVAAIPFYCYRWTVTPGVTGWAQIQQGYCATLEENREKLAYDLFYIKHRSLALDLLILFQTIKILILGRGAR